MSTSARIQADGWFKLWGNLRMDPVSVLTGTTMDRILDDELVHALLRLTRGWRHGPGGSIRPAESPQ